MSEQEYNELAGRLCRVVGLTEEELQVLAAAPVEVLRTLLRKPRYQKLALQPCGGYYCSEEHGHLDCEPQTSA